jgi:hypothetical protein
LADSPAWACAFSGAGPDGLHLARFARAPGQSRRETAAVSKDRDDLIDQRDTARADAASASAPDLPARAAAPPG